MLNQINLARAPWTSTGDRISAATYAGSVATVLEPTTLSDRDKQTVKGIIRDPSAGGGTTRTRLPDLVMTLRQLDAGGRSKAGGVPGNRDQGDEYVISRLDA